MYLEKRFVNNDGSLLFIECIIDDIADDDPFHIGDIFTIVFVSAIFWALHLLLLMLPVSKRNIK